MRSQGLISNKAMLHNKIHKKCKKCVMNRTLSCCKKQQRQTSKTPPLFSEQNKNPLASSPPGFSSSLPSYVCLCSPDGEGGGQRSLSLCTQVCKQLISQAAVSLGTGTELLGGTLYSTLTQTHTLATPPLC